MLGKKITEPEPVEFEITTFGLYAVSITARCQSGKLLGIRGGENLRVEIDGITLREIPPEDKPQYVDIPPAWNGTQLKGLSKTVIFLLPLNKGKHILKYIPKPSATIEQYSITLFHNVPNITFDLNNQAEDGDRRPWYTFALVNLPLHSLSVDTTVNWHWFDGDDVKLIIDGQIEENFENKRWKDWFWHATVGQVFSGQKREQQSFTKNLQKGINYIELWADRMPILHSVTLNLGDFTPNRIPSVDDPEWTGDFGDDTDQIILARALFGEARNTLVPDEARIAIGWVIRNRVEDSRWPDKYYQVITTPEHVSSFNEGDENRPYVEDPLQTHKDIDQEAWIHTCDIAGKIINSKLSDPTKGANHYYDDSINASQTESTIYFYRL